MKISNPPVATDLMATARSFGNYDLASALADIIDNSIQAKASTLEINFEPKETDIIVRVRDNGTGMTGDELKAAMRPASANPYTKRAPEDLGRFGWGMKSASLSQARILTVVSWQENNFVAARWDIDDIHDWSMEFFENTDASLLLKTPTNSRSGTEIIWSNSDRLKGNKHGVDADELAQNIATAREKLSLIFHRYLAGETQAKLSISLNDLPIKPTDPFMSSHDATQTLDPEAIQTNNGSKVIVQPFILPHFSKLTVEEQRSLGGEEGMIRNQGFYIYRNKRLIIHGTWFRLVPHGELSQLTRVKIDLPNNLDDEWKITLDKSDAQLPSILKKRLLKVIKNFNKRSISVHRKKGVSTSIDSIEPVWSRLIKNGQVIYRINRKHPLISESLDNQIGEDVFSMLETYFPSDRLISDSEKGVTQGPTDITQFNNLIMHLFTNYLKLTKSSDQNLSGFIKYVTKAEPFASQSAYATSYVKEKLSEYFNK
ncbi:MAG TPA: ATP-binding protein [Idiomarina loihiensis]|uniref:ATP-binding protein n=1 Tax=Idiomarina loihiensis TaxID=135577 RepID=UPI000E95B673|nr:ATP-binding protein [Idiomarina loihiensis]